jgi:hypothetical protein
MAKGDMQRIDTSNRLINTLIVQCITGALDIYVGEGTSGPPDFRFQSGLGPQQIWLPLNNYVITAAAPIAVQAVVRVIGDGSRRHYGENDIHLLSGI